MGLARLFVGADSVRRRRVVAGHVPIAEAVVALAGDAALLVAAELGERPHDPVAGHRVVHDIQVQPLAVVPKE